MASLEHARIASLVSSVGEHITEVAELAEALTGSEKESTAAALYEAERSLEMARRSLDRAASELRS